MSGSWCRTTSTSPCSRPAPATSFRSTPVMAQTTRVRTRQPYVHRRSVSVVKRCAQLCRATPSPTRRARATALLTYFSALCELRRPSTRRRRSAGIPRIVNRHSVAPQIQRTQVLPRVGEGRRQGLAQVSNGRHVPPPTNSATKNIST